MVISRKTILLAVLNLAAAASIGIIAGLMYKGASGAKPAEDDNLRERIAALAGTVDADTGVAVIFPDGDTLTFTGGDRKGYPMLSVFKFHQAFAVCDSLRRAGTSLDRKIKVTREQLHKDTWSPLRDKYPDGGSFTYRELLEYTLVQSDNNACDILFAALSGPSGTESYIRSLGFTDVSIGCTEDMMHRDLQNCYRNSTTPLSAARLMEWFYGMRSSDSYFSFLWETMSGCATGQARIPAYISGKAAAIAHKTGTGDTLPDGRIIGVNDIGIVELPDGRHFAIAVFVSDAAATLRECEELIARITEAVYSYAGNGSRRPV